MSGANRRGREPGREDVNMCRGMRWRGDSLGFARDSLDESGSRDRGLLESSPECWRAPGCPGGLSAPSEAAAAPPPCRGVARISILEGVVDSSGRVAGAIGRGVATVSTVEPCGAVISTPHAGRTAGYGIKLGDKLVTKTDAKGP